MNAPLPGVARTAREPVLLRLSGLWCASCARAVEGVLARQPGVVEARVAFATSTAVIEAAPDQVDEEAWCAAVRAAGYGAEPWSSASDPHDADEALLQDVRLRVAVAAFLGMWTMVLSAVLHLTTAAQVPPDVRTWLALVSGALGTAVVFGAGSQVLLAGWRTVRARVPGMDALVSLGALSAWGLSGVQLLLGSHEVWFDTAAMLIAFLLAGRLIELSVRRRGTDAMARLLERAPDRVERVDGEVVPVSQVRAGEVVRIPAGARIPVDGRVVGGSSYVDRSLLTGEAELARVQVGATVEAGAVNGEGVLTLRVEAALGERRLDRIAATVRRALDQRSELQDLAQRLAEHLVPVVLGLALVSFVGVGLLTGQWQEAALRAVAVLVVTCPCALSVAVPLTTASTVVAAARDGILFRSVDALHRAASVDGVALDKTGTLTEGRPRVVAVRPAEGTSTAELLRLAASAELGTEHPLAAAVRHAAAARGLDPDPSGTRRTVAGRGVEHTRADGSLVRVGRPDWALPDASSRPSLPDDATAAIAVCIDGRFLGLLLAADAPRPEAAAVLRALPGEPALLSGDRSAAVSAVATSLGIPTWQAACTPEDKAAWLTAPERAGARFAFVGDGYNDAPALAAAHLGVALADGADAARASAPVVLREGGLSQLPRALALARRTRRRIRTSLIWAFSYNLVMVPLAMGGWIHPGLAVVAMLLSSVTVTVNAVR